ncbi:ABC transporter permease [Paenibacillus tarimensis]
MNAILGAQLHQLKRNPFTLLIMIAMTILFTFVMGANASGKVTVYTYPDSGMKPAEAEAWLERLNRSDTFAFKPEEEDKAKSRVTEGKADFALQLFTEDYRVITAVDNTNVPVLDHYVRTVYEEELAIRKAEAAAAGTSFRAELERRLQSPVLAITSTKVETEQDFKYDAQIQGLLGYALFFAIFTVAYSLNLLLEEKRSGIWDRVILSPVPKTAMYIGHLVMSFAAGYLQIAIVFIVFRYGFAFPLGDSFATLLVLIAFYTLAVVALGMLLAGMVRTPQQMQVLIPIVSVSMAMIGGAYWPIEIVSNPVLITLSKFVPVTYGMEALKGVVYYGHTWEQLLRPVSYLLLFAVVCMGIGINLIERRSR